MCLCVCAVCTNLCLFPSGYILIAPLNLISVKSHNELVRNLKLYQNHEDFELKKLLMNVLTILIKDQSAIQVGVHVKALVKVDPYCFN